MRETGPIWAAAVAFCGGATLLKIRKQGLKE
jgi:hypothetical protein